MKKLPAFEKSVSVSSLGFMLLTAGFLTWPTAAVADLKAGATIAQQGAGAATACLACHGAKGEGQAAAGFPRLAGQNKEYLIKQLGDFASGGRSNPVMAPIASNLNKQQMNDVAEYYASLPAWKPTTPASQPTDKNYALGAQLAARGNWSAGVPSCYACHGEGGVGVAPHFPALAGQPASYTEKQLKHWQAKERKNDPQGLMNSVAGKLTEAEIKAVSIFFENPQLVRKEK